MSDPTYYSTFTEKGLALLTESIRKGTKLTISHMAFGDGKGKIPTPDEKFTQLVNEVHRTPLNNLATDPNNANWLRAESILSSSTGGFNIRELGLYAGNTLVAYSNYPPTYKPTPDDGTARVMTFRMILQIDNVSNFELVIDPDVVLATIQYVNEIVTGKKIKLWDGRSLDEHAQQFLSVKSYGALGTGIDTRLAQKFKTLAEAQEVYPNAQSLQDTIDLVAIEKALVNHRNVHIPNGHYLINRSIAIPSFTHFKGEGMQTIISCTGDMERYEHMIVNSEGNYTIGIKTDDEVITLVNKNKGNSSIRISNLFLRGDLDTRKQMTRSGICLKYVRDCSINNVKVAWPGYHGIDISDASEGRLTDIKSTETRFETKPSHNISIEDCIIEYNGDDGITTHYSSDISIRQCLIRYVSQIFAGGNGIEIDDGSRNIHIENVTVINQFCGIVVKCHDNAPAPYNITISNCTTHFCGYGYYFYALQEQNTLKNYAATANNITLNNCTAIKCKRFSHINGREPYGLFISNYSGILISNFSTIGHLATHLKDVDVSDYQPFYRKADESLELVPTQMMPFDTVIKDSSGNDITYLTEKNINISRNSRNIVLNGVYMYGEIAAALIRIQTLSTYHVILNNIFIKDSIGNCISISVDATKVHISNVRAESTSTTDNENNYVIATGGATPIWEHSSFENIQAFNYAGNFKFYQTVQKNYSSLSRPTKFIGLNTDETPPLAVSSSSSTANLIAFSVFNNDIGKLAITGNSFRHLVNDGLAQWFGQIKSGNDVPLWGIHGNSNFIPYSSDVYDLGTLGNRVRQVVAQRFVYQSNIYDSAGVGSPEGVVTAGIGSTYRRTDGGSGTAFYIKETGAGNTGWVAK